MRLKRAKQIETLKSNTQSQNFHTTQLPTGTNEDVGDSVSCLIFALTLPGVTGCHPGAPQQKVQYSGREKTMQQRLRRLA